jgi:hypothetical protein
MRNLSVSKIHRLKKSELPLSEWIEKEKALYTKKQSDGKIDGMDFETWLNHRHAPRDKNKGADATEEIKNAEGAIEPENIENADSESEQENASGVVTSLLNKTADKMKTDSASPAPIQSSPAKKTIFGMKPLVFYSATGSILLILGVLTYRIIKKRLK